MWLGLYGVPAAKQEGLIHMRSFVYCIKSTAKYAVGANAIKKKVVFSAFCAGLLISSVTYAALIVVGQVAPLSGIEANQGRAYAAGMRICFESINNGGGVNGHTFSLVRKDDEGRSENTVSATKQILQHDNPLVLAGYFGSRNIADLVVSGVLEKEKIALVGYRTGEVTPGAPFLYGVRAGLRDEIDKLTQHLATIGISRLGLVYEDGQGEAALLAAVNDAVNKATVTVVAKSSYRAGTVQVSPSVATMIATAPQAVLLVTSGAAAAGFIEQYRAAGGGAQLFAHSGADVEQLSKRLSQEQMQGVAIVQVLPNPYKILGRLTKEFNDTVSKAQNLEVPVSYSMMEGYIAAKVIVEAVRRQGRTPSRAGMVAALDGMNSYDLGGYLISFKPGMRSGSRFVELSIISGSGKIRQ